MGNFFVRGNNFVLMPCTLRPYKQETLLEYFLTAAVTFYVQVEIELFFSCAKWNLEQKGNGVAPW